MDRGALAVSSEAVSKDEVMAFADIMRYECYFAPTLSFFFVLCNYIAGRFIDKVLLIATIIFIHRYYS